MATDPQSLYMQLGNLAESMPDLSGALDSVALRWLGRAQALVSEVKYSEGVSLETEIRSLLEADFDRHEWARKIEFRFFRALTKAELSAPVAAQGAFIPAGSVFEAQAEIGKLLSRAKRDVLIVDPYMDEKVLSDFAPLAPEGVSLRLLADQATHKPILGSAVQRWVAQYGVKRALEAKLAPARTLHDRLISIDKSTIWTVSQSFNGIAARSPATIVRIDGETANLKMAAYQALWDSAVPI